MPDYDFYRALGGTLDQEDFTRLVWKAWAYLEALTLGRVNGTLPVAADKKVKRCCCALIDEYANQDKGGEVVSASNDGYTESYAASGKTPDQRLYTIATIHLTTTGLLYSGIGGACCAGLY